MKRLTFSGYFSKTGWTQERGNGEILWYEGKQLEAIKIQSNVDLIVEGWCPSDAAWISPDREGVIGVIGKNKGLSAIKVATKDSGRASVCYRVYLKNSGWTDFCRDGECCGVSEAKAKTVIEGIQFFWMGVNDDLNIRIKKADQNLSEYTWIKEHLFIHNSDDMLFASTKSYLNGTRPKVLELEQGVLLPLKETSRTRSGTYVGGVLDKELNWVAGHERKKNKYLNYACVGGYEVDEQEIQESDEEVIFGGIFIKTFGLFFAECLSRLWYVVANETNLRIAILPIPGHEEFLHDFTQLLGIEDQRLLVVDKPTRFTKVLVPDQTVRLWSDFRKEYISIYNKIMEDIVPGKQEKIYLTKSVLPVQDGLNEHFFERFFSKRGFKIIAPEKYSIRELISMMAGAKEVICTEGTLSHLGLFCKKGTSFTIFRRTDDSILIPQLIINQARGLMVTYVDATHNFLPVINSDGVYLYGPTPFFVEYLKDNHIDYTEGELAFDVGDFCYKYIKMWYEKYSVVKNFDGIAGKTLTDVMSCMNQEFGKEEFIDKNYVTQAQKQEKKLLLRAEILEQENLALKEKLKELEKREVEFQKREAEFKKRETEFEKCEAEIKKREAEFQNREVELEKSDRELEKNDDELNKNETGSAQTSTNWKPNRKRRRKMR